MQTLGSRQAFASRLSTTASRAQSHIGAGIGSRPLVSFRSLRQISLRRATSGGADTLEQRKQEAKEWISAWRGNGANGANGTEKEESASAPPQAVSAAKNNGATAEEALDDDDDDDEFDDEFNFDDGDYEEDDTEGQDPDFEESARSEGPFKYNIPNSDKSGKFAPDYTLSDGSVIFTSKTLDSVKRS